MESEWDDYTKDAGVYFDSYVMAQLQLHVNTVMILESNNAVKVKI
jgi:hypothetical protein